jgi:uncharacterized membrane protein
MQLCTLERRRVVDVLCHIDIDVPLDVVFSYYSDQSRLQEWIPGGGILEFTPLSAPPKKPGSRYRMAYRSLGVTFRLITELTALDTNRLSVMEQVSGDYKCFRYEMHFSPAGANGSQLEMRITARLPWGILGSIADWLSRPLVRGDIEKALQRFKAGVEALEYQPPAPTSHAGRV